MIVSIFKFFFWVECKGITPWAHGNDTAFGLHGQALRPRLLHILWPSCLSMQASGSIISMSPRPGMVSYWGQGLCFPARPWERVHPTFAPISWDYNTVLIGYYDYHPVTKSPKIGSYDCSQIPFYYSRIIAL